MINDIFIMRQKEKYFVFGIGHFPWDSQCSEEITEMQNFRESNVLTKEITK